jgi:hypothetical protein
MLLGSSNWEEEVDGTCSTRRKMRVTGYTVLVRKPERKRLMGRPRCRWEVVVIIVMMIIIIIIINECEGLGWINVAQDKFLWGSVKSGEILELLS